MFPRAPLPAASSHFSEVAHRADRASDAAVGAAWAAQRELFGHVQKLHRSFLCPLPQACNSRGRHGHAVVLPKRVPTDANDAAARNRSRISGLGGPSDDSFTSDLRDLFLAVSDLLDPWQSRAII